MSRDNDGSCVNAKVLDRKGREIDSIHENLLSRFRPGEAYHDEQQIVILNQRVLRLQGCQYTIMRLLLEGQEVTDDALSLALYQQRADRENQERLTKHLSRSRTRLRSHELTIRRVHGAGYLLAVTTEVPDFSCTSHPL